tara:strand:+ start:26763 stop:26933 length:171 start_codon:yes stop_codon:yes gene_type:complete
MENKINKTVSVVDDLSAAHSLCVILARASEDDQHVNAVAVQIAQLLNKSVNALGDQ